MSISIKELSTKLNQVKHRFNTLQEIVLSKYEHIGDQELKALKIKEERSSIHSKTFLELIDLSDLIQPIRNELNTKREKHRFGYQSDNESQYQSAIILLNTKPNIEKLSIELDRGLKANRKTFVSTLLNSYEAGLYAASELQGKAFYIQIIEEIKTTFNNLSGIAEIENDLQELNKIEKRIKNFTELTSVGKYHYMFFADAVLTAEEINTNLKYLNEHTEIPLEVRLHLKNEMAKANPNMVNDFSDMPMIG